MRWLAIYTGLAPACGASLAIGGKIVRGLLASTLLGCLIASTSSASEIQPPDVYQNTLIVRGERERIRLAMQKPHDPRLEIAVRNAQPREVFFQAVTLWIKADRLCKELRGARLPETTKVEVAPPADVEPSDVWEMTKNTLGRTYSAVAARYKNRRIESLSTPTESCPDPVFRAARSGALVAAGAATRGYFNEHGIDRAQTILGKALWARVVSGEPLGERPTILLEPDQGAVVGHAPADNGDVDIYMARLPRSLEPTLRESNPAGP